MLKVFGLAAATLFFAACAAPSSEAGGAAPSAGNTAFPPSAWRLERLGGAGVMRPAAGATLTFGADGRVSGNGPCNAFSGPATLGPAGALKIGPLAATKKACLPDTRMDAEARYFKALELVARYEKSNGMLILLDDKGVEVLAFAPVE